MLDQVSFTELVKKVKSYKSITGKAAYINCRVEQDVLYFIRANTGKAWKIHLLEVYDVYLKEEVINTVVLRNYMRSRVYSPTLGLLIAMGLYNQKGLKN